MSTPRRTVLISWRIVSPRKLQETRAGGPNDEREDTPPVPVISTGNDASRYNDLP